MIIYVDILIIINLIVNYFLIKSVEKMLRKKLKIYRAILSSFIGAISSLYIFLPINNILLDIIFKLVLCLIMTFVAFGVEKIKFFIKSSFLLFMVTALFAGIMMAIFQIFKPNGMYTEKMIVYFNISPLSLVMFTVIFYLLLNVFIRVFGRTAPCSKQCEITVFYENNSIKLNALIDTGNSLTDIFGESEIIIADSNFLREFLKNIADISNRYRVIPFKTVSGEDLLDGYRMDKAIVLNNKKIIELKSPILALSKIKIADDFNAIINPQILE